MDGEPIRPVKVLVDEDGACAQFLLSANPLQDSSNDHITISIQNTPDRICISTQCSLAEGAHDIAPFGRAVVSEATHIYAQGFGMEGPSGYFPVSQEARYSHGLVGIRGTSTSLVCYATDHRHFSARFLMQKHTELFSSPTVFSGGFNLENTRTGSFTLPDLWLEEHTDLLTGMRQAAERIAEDMGARTDKDPAFHWCSWYYLYENMDMDHLRDYTAGFRSEGIDFSTIQIDAGYTPHIGDWLITNHRYPNGLGEAADIIRAADYKAGIWIAPFAVGDQSQLYQNHPDWVVRDRDGRPFVQFGSYAEPKIWGNTDCDYYVLDATHPEAMAYLKQVFTSLYEAGFSLFKIDFLLWTMMDSGEVRRFDPSMTSVEIIRSVLQMVREIVGEEGYILGSIAPFMPLVGLVDGMRIAGDVGAQWSDTYGPVNLLQELPYDNYFNNIFWQNDPDSVLLRDFGSDINEAEVQSLALIQALSGGVITTSDPIHRISPARKKLLALIRPGERVCPTFFGLLDGREEICIGHQLPQGNLLFVMNPTDHPIQICVSLADYFGEGEWYYYHWQASDERCSFEKKEYIMEELQPHHSLLGFAAREKRTAVITNIWEW